MIAPLKSDRLNSDKLGMGRSEEISVRTVAKDKGILVSEMAEIKYDPKFKLQGVFGSTTGIKLEPVGATVKDETIPKATGRILSMGDALVDLAGGVFCLGGLNFLCWEGGCGSPPLGSYEYHQDDGGLPSLIDGGGFSFDGGVPPIEDGGVFSRDGGAIEDGGPMAADGGPIAEDGGSIADGGTIRQDGGPMADGGTPVDGGLIRDGGQPDGGRADGGVTCGCEPDENGHITYRFTDPYFLEDIRRWTGRQGRDLTCEDVLSRHYIGVSNINISSISGLECFSNLTNLGIGSTSISDISPLSGLTNLTQLALGGNNISDISPLSGLTKLTTLTFRVNQRKISDISPLANLTNLTGLQFDDNRVNYNVSDISFLSNLTKLTHIFLREDGISELPSLVNLINWKCIDLSNNQLSDITPLIENTRRCGDIQCFVKLQGNPLIPSSQIAELIANGVYLNNDFFCPPYSP